MIVSRFRKPWLLFVFVGIACMFCETLYSAENGQDNNYIRIKAKSANLDIIEGEVEITYETGETKTYQAGDEVPPLTDGVILKILSGSIKVQAGNATVELAEGDSAIIFVDAGYRTTSVQLPGDYPKEVTVLSGTQKETLSGGDTYWAPLTATADPSPTKDTPKPKDDSGSPAIGDLSTTGDSAGTEGEDRIPRDATPEDTEAPKPPSRRRSTSPSGN